MIYGSVCSGIESATVAWHPLGWKPAFFSEIEKFPSAVLAHHYPDVPNRGDMTKFKEWPDAKLDVLVGGTPCQSFSVAGLRKGLDDPRGNLMLTYLAIAARYRPTWLVWENVPGVLSSWTDETDQDGNPTGYETNDFDCFLGGLAELGYGFAYRVLDAQHFGVPQRRRRVFVVGHIGDWRRAAAVLFERHSLSGNTPPSREKGKDAARRITPSFGIRSANTSSNGWGISEELTHTLDQAQPHFVATPSTGQISHCLNAGGMGRQDYETETLIAHSLRGEGFDTSEDGTGRGTPLTVAPTLTSNGDAHSGYRDEHGLVPVAIQAGALRENPSSGPDGIGVQKHIAYTLEARSEVQAVMSSMQVRRLTPRECERLQGFPDDYTLIPGRTADGPRYKALGNSMAVPCMSWVGSRIDAVQRITSIQKQEAA